MEIMTIEGVVELAQSLGNKRGWKQQMPPSPPGLPAGGTWTQETVGDMVRLRYQLAKGQKSHIIGEWRAADAPAPHVNGTGPKPPAPRKPEPVAGGVETLRATSLREPAPLILIEPGPEGTRFNAYGLDVPDIIEELRRALVHLVATSAGVEVISVTIPRGAAVVVVVERAPVRPQPQRRPATKGKLKRTVSYGGRLDDEDFDDVDADEDNRW